MARPFVASASVGPRPSGLPRNAAESARRGAEPRSRCGAVALVDIWHLDSARSWMRSVMAMARSGRMRPRRAPDSNSPCHHSHPGAHATAAGRGGKTHRTARNGPAFIIFAPRLRLTAPSSTKLVPLPPGPPATPNGSTENESQPVRQIVERDDRRDSAEEGGGGVRAIARPAPLRPGDERQPRRGRWTDESLKARVEVGLRIPVSQEITHVVRAEGKMEKDGDPREGLCDVVSCAATPVGEKREREHRSDERCDERMAFH